MPLAARRAAFNARPVHRPGTVDNQRQVNRRAPLRLGRLRRRSDIEQQVALTALAGRDQILVPLGADDNVTFLRA